MTLKKGLAPRAKEFYNSQCYWTSIKTHHRKIFLILTVLWEQYGQTEIYSEGQLMVFILVPLFNEHCSENYFLQGWI